MRLNATMKWITFILLMMSISSVFAQARFIYVKAMEENLRSAPGGKKIGALLEGTELIYLEEKDNWVKVALTGWIWKASLSELKTGLVTGEFRALHILVKTRAEAEDILQQIRAGKDFSELAKTKSISPSATIGGDLGYFNKGDFDTKIEAAIANLKINQVSEIIETPQGFNIFKRIK